MTPGLPFDFEGTEATIDLASGDGLMPTFLAFPPGNGPWPAVILFMDAVGLREEIRDIARFIAESGYVCLTPNLYYRDGGASFDPHEPFRQRDKFMPLAARLTREAILGDTAAILSWARDEPRIAPGLKGCIGFCMGGRFVAWAAAEFPEVLQASVSLFGPHLVTTKPDSPHRQVSRIRGEIFFGFGGEDKFIPLEEINVLEEALAAARCKWRIEIYPAAEHAFIFPLRWCYQAEASEKAWQGAITTFGRVLGKRN